MVTAVSDAGERFRKIRGYVGMKRLVAALEAHGASLNPYQAERQGLPALQAS